MQGREHLQNSDDGNDTEEDSDSEEETEGKEKKDPILRHMFVLEDLEFAVLDKSGMVRMMRGGRRDKGRRSRGSGSRRSDKSRRRRKSRS